MRRRHPIISCCVLLGAVTAAMVLGAGDASAEVCGIKADGPRNYDSPQAANADGARVMHPGQCQSLLCLGWAAQTTFLNSAAICGTDPLTHEKVTYPNVCAEEHAMADFVHNGPCP